MKNISIYSKVFIRIFFYLSAFFLFINDVFARGGGGGSGGGGGGGGGGSFGGSGGSGGYNLIIFILQFSVFALIFIGGWYLHRKKVKKAKEIITKAQATDSVWQESNLTKRVSDVFFRFQKDWSDYNSEVMKEYCVNKFQEKVALELLVLKSQNRKNLVNNPKILSITILEADDENDNSKDNFTAEVHAQAEDQLIDLQANSILMTESNVFVEYWNFLRDGNNWNLNTISQETESKFTYENDISEFAKANNFFYDPDFGWLMMPNKGVIFKRSNFKTSDINNHVVGTFRGKILEFYTFIPNPARNQNNLNYLVAQTNLPVDYNDILVRRRRWFWNFAPSGLRRIQTESNDFDKKFCLYAHPKDQINSFVLLSPDFMEEVYNLPFELNIEIVGNFLYFYTKGRQGINYNEMLRLISKAFDSMRSN